MTFPLQANGYVDCPPALFYWFFGESQRMFWDYIDSLTPAQLEEEYQGFEFSAAPDKLDACYSAYVWLSLTDCDWVTPDWFLVPR